MCLVRNSEDAVLVNTNEPVASRTPRERLEILSSTWKVRDPYLSSRALEMQEGKRQWSNMEGTTQGETGGDTESGRGEGGKLGRSRGRGT